ncbi:MAG: TIGR04282 family arsenosugar biosynthesis glycosyltransferase [Parvularculaceae bacterium]
MRGTLIIFVKAPVAGRVKTRLAKGLGPGRAAALYRRLCANTIGAAAKGSWRTILAVDPAASVRGFGNLWPLELARIEQGRGDLGARMRRAIDAAPCGPVVIIGSDAPALRTRHIRAAFNAMAGNDAVFGPAPDGGYWLIGLARRRGAATLFENVRWSSEHALADTLSTFPAFYRVASLVPLADIDDAGDLALAGPRALMRSVAVVNSGAGSVVNDSAAAK